MKHLILGTAGHVDHGKTALVKALTGIDCDTHKEEKRRGITINLGFAHLALPDGSVVGIVDVPGHCDFVHTMVSGASGIDFALLAIAADNGVMPQTREHAQIMELLGIKSGIIAVTKTDLVGAEAIEKVYGGIREFTKNSYLEPWPLCGVSSITGSGIARLKQTIGDVAKSIHERPAGQVFRMYIDRIFSVSGFGTVVTGSVKAGSLRIDQTAYLLPPGKEARVRRLERYGREVAEVKAGDRASCNLVGLNKADFQRGMLIADRMLRSSRLLDATITLFPDSPQLSLWTQVVFLMDAFETQARVHLIDTDRLPGGSRALAQVHLFTPCIAQTGDRFVIRTSSGGATLGGGKIIDAAPLHHRRRPPALVSTLSRMAEGALPERMAVEIRKHVAGVSGKYLADALNCALEEIVGAVRDGLPDGIMEYDSDNARFFISRSAAGLLAAAIVDNLRSYHERHPLDNNGRTFDELLGILKIAGGGEGGGFLAAFLSALCAEGTIKKAGHSFALAGHRVSLSPEISDHASRIEGYFKDCRMQTPLAAELAKTARNLGIDGPQLKSILRYLVDSKLLYGVEGSYLHADIVDGCRKKLLAELDTSPEGMTVAQFRDLVSGNRKLCLLLLAIYEREGVTRREGDRRVITDKGRDVLRRL